MKRIASVVLALAGIVAPQAAFAHPGHDTSSFAAGLVHPLTGADHIAAMLLVGLGAAIFVRRAGWMLPVTFLLAAMAGFASFTWLPASLVEAGIGASLIALGLATVLRVRTPAPLAMLAIALFGYAHGAAHGVETPAGATPLVFAAGFLLASAVLHLTGYALARILPLPALRILGAGSAGLGLALATLS